MNPGFKIMRDAQRCIACYECVILCPQSGEDKPNPVLVYPKELGHPPEVHCIENCIQCMTCWDFCRSQAITFENHHLVARLVQDQAAHAKVARII